MISMTRGIRRQRAMILNPGNRPKSILSISFAATCFILLLSCPTQAAPDETYGRVTNVIDGDTFELEIEKADPRVEGRTERVRLADVDSPDMKTGEGPAARDFTYSVLQDKKVYLDIDDLSASGRDAEGRLVCVACLAGAYGQPLAAPNFNRMLVDSGHARLDNSTDNEFDPQYWWDEGSYDLPGGALEDVGRDIKEELLPQIEESAENALDRAARDMWQWFKAQMGL
jgi:endonuclease YncB( thermonuclease family)